MSDLTDAAERAPEFVEQLASEMFEGKYDNNHMLLGTLHDGDSMLQVQLIVTRNTEEFLDEC